jgi:hypothetical protein
MHPRLHTMHGQKVARVELVTLVRLGQVAELEAAAVDSALGGREAGVERRRDLLVAVIDRIDQEQHYSLRRSAALGALQLRPPTPLPARRMST